MPAPHVGIKGSPNLACLSQGAAGLGAALQSVFTWWMACRCAFCWWRSVAAPCLFPGDHLSCWWILLIAAELREVEESKNAHIQSLMQSHEKVCTNEQEGCSVNQNSHGWRGDKRGECLHVLPACLFPHACGPLQIYARMPCACLLACQWLHTHHPVLPSRRPSEK